MTRFEAIKSMTIEDLAEFNIKYKDECFCSFCVTSDGSVFSLEKKNDALRHELQWLSGEMQLHIYINHYNGDFYSSAYELDFNDLYCETCGSLDSCIGLMDEDELRRFLVDYSLVHKNNIEENLDSLVYQLFKKNT